MEPSVIFVKTAQGDEAVQQRTRLVQRNLRTVLIVVDGRSTVAELADKVGNREMVLSALEQLERDGYIEVSLNGPLLADAEASLPAVAAEPEAEAASPFAYPPEVPPEVPPAPVEPVAPQMPPVVENIAVVAAAADDDPFLTPGKKRQAEIAVVPVARENKAEGFFAGLRKRREAAAKEKAEAKAAAVDAEVSIAPIRRGPRAERSIYALGTMAFGALILIAVLAVFAFPYGIYRADIERALGAALGQTVKISAVRASFSPTPSLVLDRVEIGDGLLIGEVRATPEIGSLAGAEKRFSKVLLVAAGAQLESLLALVPAAGKLARGDGFLVRSLAFSGLNLKFMDYELKDCSGDLPLSAGSAAVLTLRNAPGTLKLEIKPDGDVLALGIEGRAWVPAEGTPFVWDALSAQGEIRRGNVTLRKIDGRMFDGVVQGQAAATWGAASVNLRAELDVEHASAKRVAAALGSGVGVDGDLNGRVRLTAAGESLLKARESLHAEGDFGIKRGALLGLDFADAIRRSGRGASRGGSTSFDQMTGAFAMDGAATRLSAIEIVSGAMRATGSAMQAANQQLSGSLDVQLRGAGVNVRMPVSLAGTLKDPQLFGGRR